jgi:hypothetical protein
VKFVTSVNCGGGGARTFVYVETTERKQCVAVNEDYSLTAGTAAHPQYYNPGTLFHLIRFGMLNPYPANVENRISS